MTFRRALLVGARLGVVIGLLLIAVGLIDDWRRDRTATAELVPFEEPGGGW